MRIEVSLKRSARGWDDELGREWTLCGQTRLHIGANGSTMGEKTTLDKIHNPLCGHLPSYSKTRWLTIDAQVPAQVSRHISASHRVLYAYESLEVSWQKWSFENCHPRCVDNWQYTLKMNYVTGALYWSWSTTIWSSSSFSTSSSPFSTASSSSSRRRRGRFANHFLGQKMTLFSSRFCWRRN